MTLRMKIIISLILISLGIVCRLLPHAWNFTPIMAIALFAGVYLGKRYALILPIAAMFIGDMFIGFYFWKLMLVIYICFAIIGLLGLAIKKYKSAETILAGSILAAVIFFLATNWAVWQFSSWYTKNLAGLMQCYILALPFFKNTLLGNIFYSGVLFGSYELVKFSLKSKYAYSLSKKVL